MAGHDLTVTLVDKTGPGARSVERNLNGITHSASNMAQGMGRTTSSLAGASAAMRTAAGAAIALGSAIAVRQVIEYADAWTNVTNRLKLVTKGSEDLAKAQDTVFRIAKETRGDLDATANLYARIARSTTKLKASEEQLATATRAINEAFIVSGATAEEAQRAVIQLGQALGSGILQSDELRAVLEQAPRLARAIAEGLDTDIGKIRQMGAEGKLTAAAVFGAILKQSEKIHVEFKQTGATAAQGFTAMSNSAERFVGRLNDATGASQVLYKAMFGLAFAMDIMAEGIKRAQKHDYTKQTPFFSSQEQATAP